MLCSYNEDNSENECITAICRHMDEPKTQYGLQEASHSKHIQYESIHTPDII